MFEQLHIEGFRGLRDLTLTGLRRVNLLVGTNNCGKTSVLEAVHVLAATGRVAPISLSLQRRAEFRDSGDGELDISHLVHGRSLALGSGFKVSGQGERGKQEVVVTLRKADEKEVLRAARRGVRVKGRIAPSMVPVLEPPLTLHLTWSSGSDGLTVRWPLTSRGGLAADAFSYGDDDHDDDEAASDTAIEFVTTSGLDLDRVVELFDAISLSDEEDGVVDALRGIEPTIERIASARLSKQTTRWQPRGTIKLLVGKDVVPIGSMGDGIARLLGIALILVGAKDGLLLVDEIDTGLHYSVLTKMWKMVLETSRRLGVQVFATTHSRDCVDALAEVAQDDGQDISLQRIERGKLHAVPMSEAAIKRAAERGIEVR